MCLKVSEEKTAKQDLVLMAGSWIYKKQELKAQQVLLQPEVGDNGSAGHGQSVGCFMRCESMATPEQSPLSPPQLSSTLWCKNLTSGIKSHS